MRMKGAFLSLSLLLSILLIATNSLSPSCKACHDIVEKFQKGVPLSPLDKILATIGTEYCAKKKIQDPAVCKGAVTEMIDPIFNSLWKHYTDPHAVCHKLFLCPKEYFKRNLTEELQTIIKDKPKKLWEKATNRKTIKVMHMSDLHPDFFYTPGA
jgi:hypothetical protein